MPKALPPRPNLDHLRRQSKALLEALASGDDRALQTIKSHLPAAARMSAEAIRAKTFRLADAQSAIARESGFAGWPHLARHVAQLRALEGAWSFAYLEVDGHPLPMAALAASQILIDGDRFRTESPEGNYEGIFNINVEAQPHEIDIEFVAGPEAGNSNHGIFRLQGERLEICLELNGKARPTAFLTTPGSGCALERLQRKSLERPHQVTGGTGTARSEPPASQGNPADFPWVDSPTLRRLQGEWAAVELVTSGDAMAAMLLGFGVRSTSRNEMKVSFGGQTMVHALMKFDETSDPVRVDYWLLAGAAKGTVQQGLFQWIGEEACFCMAAPGRPRPPAFQSPPGSEVTLSRWRRK